MNRLDGKVAFITGGASGMGRASALLFAEEGARVFVTDVNGDGAEATAAQVREAGGDAFARAMDVSDPTGVESAFAACGAQFGGLNVLLNAAGIRGDFAYTADCTLDNWHKTIAINLTGTFLCSKFAIPLIKQSGGGSIVNIASSGGGMVGFKSLPAYCASKSGVIGLTKAVALEYIRDGIRVNCICPGATSTPMMLEAVELLGMQDRVAASPAGRMGTPEEIASTALFLASDDSSHVAGAIIPVDGAQTA